MFLRKLKCALLAGVAVTSLSASMAFAEKVTLKVATFSSATSFNTTEVLQGFLDRVKADSEGTLDYKVFAGGTLGRNPSEQLKLVVDGVADMAFVAPSYIPGELDDFSVITIPGFVTSAREASIALQRGIEAGILTPPEGVELVAQWATDVNELHTDTPLETLDDLKGLRLRANEKVLVDALDRFGAVAVTLRAPEVAEAISRGTADGALMDDLAVQSFRVSEVVDWHAQLPFGSLALMLPLNQATWDKLEEPAKAAFRKHGYMAFAEEAGRLFDEGMQAVRDEIYGGPDEHEMEITEAVLDDFYARLGPIEQVWINGDAHRQEVYDGMKAIVEDIRNGN